MKNEIKTILFASLLVAMILPFSVMSLADAAPNENANDKAKDKVSKNEQKKTKAERIKEMTDQGLKLYAGVGWVDVEKEKAKHSPVWKDHPNKPGEKIIDLDQMLKNKNIEKKFKDKFEV